MTTAELQSRITELETEVATLREKLEHAETVAGIRKGLEEIERGLGRPAKQVVAELRTKHNLPAR